MTRIKPRTLLAVQALAGALACGAAFAQDGPQRLASTQLTAGFHLINAEVASTQEQRAIGLMNRPAMPANDGMLFVNDDGFIAFFDWVAFLDQFVQVRDLVMREIDVGHEGRDGVHDRPP